MGSLAEAAAVRAVIADDEPLARQQLRDLLADVPWLAIVGEAGDGASTVATVNALRPDLLFLDIQMPAGDGLEVLRTLVHRPHVIFTSAFDSYAVEDHVGAVRSEEHTSELQSHLNLVCRLLLEKTKQE